tara:strand:+ start:63 stop:455 length:393 start_codon:yes stop_codon:yes gene_type:complete
MVEIQCPNCVEIIELEDGLFGFFECPFCQEEFGWNPERSPSNEELFNTKDFLIGLFAPSSISIIGLLYSFVFVDGWDTLVWFVLSMLVWPILAIIFLIYGIITARKFMIFGTAMSFLLMTILFFVLPIFQ